MNLLLIIPIGVFLAVLILSLARIDGKLKILDNQIRIWRRGSNQEITEGKVEPYSPRRYESVTLIIVGLLILNIAYYISKYLFLCVLYGVSRVNNEGLHFTDMSKGNSWTVSNGDQIAHGLQPLLFVICAVVWIVPTFFCFIIIRRLLPKATLACATQAEHSEPQEPSKQKPFERRSLVEKGHPLRIHSLLFLVCWVSAMVPLFLFAHAVGRMILFLIPGISIVLYIIYVRTHAHRFASMIMGTPCPQCGRRPMRYQAPRSENGNKHLLICDHCHIEWNLGPI